MNDELLTLDDISAIHKCSMRHVRDIIVKLPGFPREAPTSTPRKRLWVAREIRAYLHREYTETTHFA